VSALVPDLPLVGVTGVKVILSVVATCEFFPAVPTGRNRLLRTVVARRVDDVFEADVTPHTARVELRPCRLRLRNVINGIGSGLQVL